MLLRRGCRAAHTATKTREHASKLALDARVISTRSNMFRLRTLHSLRQRRIAALSIQLRTDVQHSAMHRSITSFPVRTVCFHTLVLFICQWSFMEAVAIAIELGQV